MSVQSLGDAETCVSIGRIVASGDREEGGGTHVAGAHPVTWPPQYTGFPRALGLMGWRIYIDY